MVKRAMVRNIIGILFLSLIVLLTGCSSTKTETIIDKPYYSESEAISYASAHLPSIMSNQYNSYENVKFKKRIGIDRGARYLGNGEWNIWVDGSYDYIDIKSYDNPYNPGTPANILIVQKPAPLPGVEAPQETMRKTVAIDPYTYKGKPILA